MNKGSNRTIEDLHKIRWKRGQFLWEPFMRKYNCDIICEVGVARGENFYKMIEHNPKVAIAVDSWKDDGVLSRTNGTPQEKYDKEYENFKKKISDKPFVKIYREYSFDAAKHFKDDYFDLVYIDGDHTYEGCLKDINDWYPKVKKDKFLLGDDYRVSRHTKVTFGVIEAVNEFCKKNSLEFTALPYYGWVIIKE